MKREEIIINDFDTVSLDYNDASPHLITGGNI